MSFNYTIKISTLESLKFLKITEWRNKYPKMFIRLLTFQKKHDMLFQTLMGNLRIFAVWCMLLNTSFNHCNNQYIVLKNKNTFVKHSSLKIRVIKQFNPIDWFWTWTCNKMSFFTMKDLKAVIRSLRLGYTGKSYDKQVYSTVSNHFSECNFSMHIAKTCLINLEQLSTIRNTSMVL